MGKKLKALMVFLVVLQMVFGGMVNAFAEENEEDKEPAGQPNVTIVNGPVFDVVAGEVNEVNINVKNLSSSIAKSVVLMPKFAEITDNPLKITTKSGSTNIVGISGNASQTITLLVDVDKTAPTQTYTVDIKFSYFNTDGVNYDSTSTIYFKVKNVNTEGSMLLENFSLEPDGLEAGGTGKISAVVRNRGPLNIYDVEVSISDLDPAVISAVGESSKKFPNFHAGTQETVSFNLSAGAEVAAGSYPVTFNIVGKDENNKEYKMSQKYYVSVGGSSSGKKSELEIRNLAEPEGVYGVNQNFDVAFELFNKGDAEAKNIKVTAKEYGEGGNIVPKSSSVISVDKLEPGASCPVSFTFAATGASVTRNYTVELAVEYEQNGKTVTFNQYAGANVSNPDNDKEDEDKKESKPKIIVSEYKADPIIVNAGEEFDLYMTFLNTHAVKNVKNVKMFLTMAEETSKDTESTGNVFTPVDSSNTFYFDSIPSKGTVTKQMRLFTVPDAQPKTYTLTVNFEYEDEEGNEYTATELLGINVQQMTKVETSEIAMPPTAEVGMPVSLYFDLYNTGKVDLSNLKVVIEGDIDTTTKSVYIGNCKSGESSYYEGSFSVLNEGENNVKLTISYDDPSGKVIEKVSEYTITGTAPVPVDDMMMGGEDMNMEGGHKMPVSINAIIISIIAVIAAAVIAVIIYKKIKHKKAEKYIEADDDIFDDEETDGGEDNKLDR